MPPPEPPLSGASGSSDQGEAAPWIPQRSRAIPFRLGRAVTGTGPPVHCLKRGLTVLRILREGSVCGSLLREEVVFLDEVVRLVG
jgi:hypothetical protein